MNTKIFAKRDLIVRLATLLYTVAFFTSVFSNAKCKFSEVLNSICKTDESSNHPIKDISKIFNDIPNLRDSWNLSFTFLVYSTWYKYPNHRYWSNTSFIYSLLAKLRAISKLFSYFYTPCIFNTEHGKTLKSMYIETHFKYFYSL